MAEELVNQELIKAIIENSSGIIPIQLEPLTQIITLFTQTLTALLGGIIGIYILSFIIRFYHDRKILKELRALRSDIEELKSGNKTKTSQRVTTNEHINPSECFH